MRRFFTIAATLFFFLTVMLKKVNFWPALLIPFSIMILEACEPLATSFEDVEDAQMMTAKNITLVPDTFSVVRVMTWNIRFGIGRLPWFGDACGNMVNYRKEEIQPTLDKIIQKINTVKPDILLLQEVDLKAKRSAYMDQLTYILDRTYFNYAASGYQWKAQFIPSDGLGRLEELNVILSRWPIEDAKRIQLPLRGDQGNLTKYFYERCCIVQGVVKVPHTSGIAILNIHVSAFATDDTKQRHMERFKSEMDVYRSNGKVLVAGGDLNELPPGSDSTDYCLQDMCPGESFHHAGDNPFHKDGSYYTPEQDWLIPVYNDYLSAIPLADYLADQQKYFTHTTRPTHFWDRTLDYLFTNGSWIPGTTVIYQEATDESDHAAVSAVLELPLLLK